MMAIKKHSVLMTQVNYQYGKNVFVPYSIGSLQAYAQTFPEVRENFRFQTPIFLREDPDEVVKSVGEPAIVCLSSYLWNWEYNKILAKNLRVAFPRRLIILGGAQISDASEEFFSEHPYVDLLVHHEGELTFVEILREFLLPRPNYSRIPGLSVRVEGNMTLKTKEAARIADLSKLPSPYLSGIFDFLVDRQLVLNVSQETNRGCPYLCTFCDWGGSTHDKVFVMDEARLLEEFEWFGRHKVEYLFNCDANYGIMSRDYALTEKMVAIRAKHGGYPKKFRMCTAKNSNDRIFAIAKILNDVGMNKGATLSFQSMDENALTIVKRSNIKLKAFSTLIRQYREADIPTYTELIIGLPGETYASTKSGVDALINAQDNVNIYAYVCSMLPNSEMSNTGYISQHKIRSVRMPILLAHSTPEPESLCEYQNVVVETASMSNDDWQRAYLFYWAVQAFHCLGLLRYVAIAFRKQFGIKYSDFYEKLIEYFDGKNDTLIGKQITVIKSIVARAMAGDRLDLVLPEFGNIYWPLEEASFLNFVKEKDDFYREIKSFIETLALQSAVPMDKGLIDNLILYQSSGIKDPFTDFAGDLEGYAREVVWYGRKSGQCFRL